MLALALAPALAPGRAVADAALVLANEGYASIPGLSGGDAAAGATAGLEALGFTTAALADGGREDAARAVARFMAEAPDSERLLVALSGRFATDGGRTWFLSADSPVPTLFGLNSNALSIESLLAVLARRPSQAVLLLGLDEAAEGPFDPWLREGLGAMEIPQGVTVLRATPEALAAFMEEELARPGGDLSALAARNPAIRADGYLPQGFAFMPEADEARPAAPAVDAAPEEGPDPGPDAASPAEAALWQGAVALGTVEAFRDYLRAHPQGRYAAEARVSVTALLSEPDRAARLAEESLRLTPNQRRAVQADLAVAGFDPRGIDGLFGEGTRAALVNWQQENGFPQTSYLDAEQVARLSAQATDRRARAEAEAQAQGEARAAAARADDDLWARAEAEGTLDALRTYLDRYPDGRHAEDAADRLALLDREAREPAEAAAAAEDEAWAAAREAGTDRAFARYLDAYPQGRFAEQARSARASAAEGEGDDARRAERRAARASERALRLAPLTIRVIEARLRALGHDPGPPDGQLDGQARAAIRGFQDASGLPATGFLSEATVASLLTGAIGERLSD